MSATLSPAQTAALRLLENRPTRYEAVLVLADGRRFRLGYSARHSKAGLLAMVRQNGPHILAKMPDLSDDARMTWRPGRGFDMGNGAMVAWAGRTQRDAIMAGDGAPFVWEG